MEFYGGKEKFRPLGTFITCHAMSNMCNCQPNNFQNKSSTIRVEYNINLVATIPYIRHFSRMKLQQEALTI